MGGVQLGRRPTVPARDIRSLTLSDWAKYPSTRTTLSLTSLPPFPPTVRSLVKKFLVMYNSSVSAMEQMANATPEQAKAGMDAWMQWAGRAGGAIVDMGSPVGTASTVSADGATATVASSAGGYSILQAESLAALAEVLKGHPHFHAPGGSLVVHEFLPMPGM